jgi:cell division transport system permease protein
MHWFYFREALRTFRQHGSLALNAVMALTAALTLAGLFLLLEHNAQSALQTIGDRREMVVYLKDEVTEAQRDELIGRLTDLYGQVKYVSKDDAWKEFTQEVGDPQLLESVDQNPLPSSLRVRLRPELLTAVAMSAAAREVSEFPEVEDVRYGAEWVQRLDELNLGLARTALAVGLAVALALVLVVYNTIRLTVLARRPAIEIMSRLGATDAFVAQPFVIEAMLEALLAAALALALMAGAYRAVSSQLVGVVFLPWSWILGFVGAALALAWMAAMWALARVLRAVRS